ncbi:MAG: RNA polymerase sigma factor [Betaproteobacteria bacterium]
MAVDRELVRRAQQGDREAYEVLARGNARRLFLVCQRILRDSDQAEDATQRALVEMWRDLPGLRDPERFEAWTYRLAVRCSLAEARRERRIRGAVRPLSDADPGEQGVGEPGEFAVVADRDAIEDAFRHLSPDHRAVVVLRYFVGLSLEEIAETVAVPTGTVASRLHYALLRLRSSLRVDEEPVAIDGRSPAWMR